MVDPLCASENSNELPAADSVVLAPDHAYRLPDVEAAEHVTSTVAACLAEHEALRHV